MQKWLYKVSLEHPGKQETRKASKTTKVFSKGPGTNVKCPSITNAPKHKHNRHKDEDLGDGWEGVQEIGQ